MRIAELPGRVAALQSALDAAGIGVRVATGAEVAAPSVDGLDPDELRACALDGGAWVLLEPHAGPLDERLLAAVDRLAACGLRALVAHPERHLGEDFHGRLADAVARGALVQGTADYLLREPTASGMADLVARGLLHVLATDAHSSHGGRPAALAAAHARLDEIDPQLGAFAREAPAALLRGEAPAPPRQPGADAA